jgi:membrane-associated phospholipid phosphatase
MTVVLIILVLLALAFGVGAVIEGLAWMFLIVAALIVAAIVFGVRSFRRAT